MAYHRTHNVIDMTDFPGLLAGKQLVASAPNKPMYGIPEPVEVNLSATAHTAPPATESAKAPITPVAAPPTLYQPTINPSPKFTMQ